MRFRLMVLVCAGVLALVSGRAAISARQPQQTAGRETNDDAIRRHADAMLREGQRIFRFDTFGDEAFWGGTLRLHEAIEGDRFGGVGAGLSPAMALAAGLKIDAEALP